MRVREIAPGEWDPFLRRFSRAHCGAFVSMISPFGRTIVDQPLRRVSRDGDDITIHIEEKRRSDHLSQRVAHARAVRLQQTDEGADAGLDIESADGTRTLLHFRWPMFQDVLDDGVE